MEFHEKLQKLRKKKGITQEALARQLFVSRAAVSKWESGRGYPSIDSLKAIAAYFSITVDELLSGEELLTLAEESSKETRQHFLDLIYGLLDCSAAIFFILPCFRQMASGTVLSVSLPSLTGISSWLKATYFVFLIAVTLWGILTLTLQNCGQARWIQAKHKLSLLLNALGILLFIISLQPYAASVLFIFLVIKATLFIKTP